MTKTTFGTELIDWAYIELLGHNCITGRVSSEEIAGTTFFRVDVPENDTYEAFAKYIHPNSVYAITPMLEEDAIKLASNWKVAPLPHISDGFRKPKPKAEPHDSADDDTPGPEDIPF